MKRIRLMSIIFAAMALAAGIAAISASAAPVFTKTFSFGSYGLEKGRIWASPGMDTDAAGNVWIAEGEMGRIQEFSPSGQYLTTITGSGEHTLEDAEDLAVAPDGNIWVMDPRLQATVEFKPNGEYIRQIKGAGTSWEVAVDSKGNIWLDENEGIPQERIYKYNSTGVFQKYVKVPLYGQIEVDSKDNVLLSGKASIYQYSSEGSYLGEIGKGVLTEPGDLAIDTEGNIWAVDFTASGRIVKGFNSKGEYLNQFNLGHEEQVPKSMTAATGGSLWIAFSAVSNQIEKWSPSVSDQLNEMPVTEPFDGGTTSWANFNEHWSKLGWAPEKGTDSTTGWRAGEAYPTVSGAYFNSTITDTGMGTATVATMTESPGNNERYFSAWLDASGSSSTREGYELRFFQSGTNKYNVTLSKWIGGKQTVLTSKTGYSFAIGGSVALVDQGGTVSAWTKAGSEFAQLLSASDATFASGNAGIEAAGNRTKLNNFKTGVL